ncbi:MAG: methyltransferase, partial [Bacteroidota bacterium]
MISLIQKKSLKFFHPVLKRLAKYYLSKPRDYRYEDITVKVYPGVFHPGLFFSTTVFLEYLKGHKLKGKLVLELGAGSGLISMFCAKNGAIVTSSDINELALQKIDENAAKNNVLLTTVRSDLFDQ